METDHGQRALTITTYGGCALVVTSILVLVRDLQSPSFLIHALMLLSLVSMFWALSAFTRRHGTAPLAADGFGTAASWLLAVTLIHLNNQRWLLPDALESSYWLVASVVAVVAVLWMAAHTRLLLMVPVVFLLQINLFSSALAAGGLNVLWQPLSLTLLAGLWILCPVRDSFWRAAARVSGAILLAFLGVFVLWLPNTLPIVAVATWFISAALFLEIGVQSKKGIAFHIGAWVATVAWVLAYHFWLHDPAVFALWLAVPPLVALSIARLTRTHRKRFQKNGVSDITLAVVRWAAADISIFLSGGMLVWLALHLPIIDSGFMIQTLIVIVALWLALGIEYRLPVFVHLALYVAPFPLSLALLYAHVIFAQSIFMGLAWQGGALLLLLFGHGLVRQSNALRTPFFIVGYGLLYGAVLLANAATLPLSLGFALVVSLVTAGVVLVGGHPVWMALVRHLAPPDQRAFAHRQLSNAFLLMGAWLSAIWVHVLLGAVGLTAAQQGMGLVLLSSLWFMFGWVLERVPKAVAWHVYSAGWLLWGTGLLLVFFSPTESIITAIFGLIVSTEEFNRVRRLHWLPIVTFQLTFIALQIAWLLKLPSDAVIAMVGVLIFFVSWWWQPRSKQAGRITEGCAWLVIGGTWLLGRQSLVPSVSLTLLLFISLVRHRDWHLIPILAISWGMLLRALGIDSVLLQTMPVAALLLFSAVGHPRLSGMLESAGIVMMLTGTMLYAQQLGFAALLPRLVVMAAIAGLLFYGVLRKRRRSVVVGAGAAGCGILYAAVSVNPWIVPLFGGVILIGASLFVETQRDGATRQLNRLTQTWSHWR